MFGAVPPFPQYIFMVWWLSKYRTRLQGVILIKHRDNFTFTFMKIYTVKIVTVSVSVFGIGLLTYRS